MVFLTLEFLARLVSLDLQWIVNLLLNNILWVFAFLAVGHFFYPNKKLLFSFLFMVFMIWASIDFAQAVGWTVLDPNFMFLNNVTTIATFAFCEADEQLRQNAMFISIIRFLALLAAFNLFFR